MADAIKSQGNDVEVIDVKENILEVLKNKKNDIDLVFNVAEGLKGEEREALVPRICEQLGIPFTAAGSQTALITLNKAKTKEVLIKNNIPTPKFQLFINQYGSLNDL